MDYPTPEEEYELMYGDELEMMEELNGKKLRKVLRRKKLLFFR